MFKLILRFIFLRIGAMLILDIALPTRTEQLHVDQHTSSTQTDHRPINGGASRWDDTSYEIHLIGGLVSSCSVGYAAYGNLKDGDSVEVQSTKLFKTCFRLTRGEEVIEANKYWKLFALVCGGLLIMLAVGWLKGGDDDGDDAGISIRLG